MAGSAFAQTTPEAGTQTARDSSDGDIVVTARRDAERLRDVPASIAVVTTKDLDRTGAVNIQSIVGLTAGVAISTGAADVGDTQINIRGLNGTRDAENNVALVVDGILKTNTSQLNQLQGDLTQVEVLKGPQGAYYGRNAAAGAIVMTTAKPGDVLAGSAKVGGGENNFYYGQATVSGPVTANLGFVAFGSYRKTDGFYRNTGPNAATRGATVDRLEQWTTGGRLVFKPSDALEIDAKARYGHADGGALSYDVVFNLPTFASALGNPLFNESVNTRKLTYTGNIYPDNKQRTIDASIKSTVNFDWATLTAWAAYTDIKQDFVADGTAAGAGRFNATPACQASTAALFAQGYVLPSPQVLGPTPNTSLFGAFGPTTCDGYQYSKRDQKDFSTEVRLASSQGPIGWSIGAYYLHIDRENGLSINQDRGLGTTRQIYNPPGSISPTSIAFFDAFKTNVYAGFGSLRWKPSTKFTVSGALRYDREERDVRSLVPNATDPVTGQLINPGLAVGALLPKSRAFGQWQPKINALFKPSDHISLYADYGIGWKAGGFNQQGTRALIVNNINTPLGTNIGVGDEYGKEVSRAFEAGFKSRLLNGRVTIEGAYYHTDVDNMQFFEVFTGGFGLVRTVSNIDRVRIDGGELAVSALLTPRWRLSASGNITDSRIIRNSARPNTVGNKAPYTPDYTINLASDITVPVGDGVEIFHRTDLRITGPTWFHTVQGQDIRTLNDLAFPGLGTANYTKTQRDTFAVVNMRLGIQKRGWSLAAFATNLLNQRTIDEVIPAPEFGGSFVAPGALRTIGVEAGFKF